MNCWFSIAIALHNFVVQSYNELLILDCASNRVRKQSSAGNNSRLRKQSSALAIECSKIRIDFNGKRVGCVYTFLYVKKCQNEFNKTYISEVQIRILMFGFGPTEIVLILAIIVMLFGASKIPDLARSLGSAMGEFKKAKIDVEKELQIGEDLSMGKIDADMQKIANELGINTKDLSKEELKKLISEKLDIH